jgi:hypothetical protein
MILIVMQRTWALVWNKSSKIPTPTRMEECNGEKYMVYEIK